MTVASGLTLRRVVLAARSGSAVPAAATAARLVARATGGDLTGLFVEDPNLVRLAAHAGLREVGAVSGVVRAMQPAGVLAALRIEADRMRRAVAGVAFAVERGDFLQAALGHVSASVAAVLSPRTPGARPHRTAGRSRADRATVLFDDSPAAHRALDLALRLEHEDVRIQVVVMATDESEFRLRRESALAQVRSAALRDSPPPPSRAGGDTLSSLALQSPQAFLILGVDGGAFTPGVLADLLERSGRPMVLVG